VGAAGDVWSLGVILYRLLTGQRPFPADSASHLTRQILHDEPPPPRRLRGDLPRELEAVCLKCLRKEPGRRYGSAGALASDLECWLAGQSVMARPEGWPRRVWARLRRRPTWGVALIVLLAGAGLAWLAGRGSPAAPPPHAPLEAPLRAGWPVELIGADGAPLRQRSWIGQTRLVRSPTEPRACQLITWGHDLIELVADPLWESYRFSAQVRQERTFQGEVGVSFLHSERPGPGGTEAFFATLTFADQGKLAGKAALNFRRFREPGYRQKSRGLEKPFEAAPGSWRRLGVLVRPAGITVFWEGKELGSLTAQGLAESAQLLAGADRTAPIAWPRRAGLGLFAYESSASFRRVVVRPLP
jgi:serine/threonine-protein kinase